MQRCGNCGEENPERGPNGIHHLFLHGTEVHFDALMAWIATLRPQAK